MDYKRFLSDLDDIQRSFDSGAITLEEAKNKLTVLNNIALSLGIPFKGSLDIKVYDPLEYSNSWGNVMSSWDDEDYSSSWDDEDYSSSWDTDNSWGDE